MNNLEKKTKKELIAKIKQLEGGRFKEIWGAGGVEELKSKVEKLEKENKGLGEKVERAKSYVTELISKLTELGKGKSEWKLTEVEILTELNEARKRIIKNLQQIEHLEEKLEIAKEEKE